MSSLMGDAITAASAFASEHAGIAISEAAVVVGLSAIRAKDRCEPAFLAEAGLSDFATPMLLDEALDELKQASWRGVVLVNPKGDIQQHVRKLLSIAACAAFFGPYSTGVDDGVVLAMSREVFAAVGDLAGTVEIVYDEQGDDGSTLISRGLVAYEHDVVHYEGAVREDLTDQMIRSWYVDAATRAQWGLGMHGLDAHFSLVVATMSFGEMEDRGTGLHLALQEETNPVLEFFAQAIKLTKDRVESLPQEQQELVGEITEIHVLQYIWDGVLGSVGKVALEEAKEQSADILGLSDCVREVGRLLGVDTALAAYRAGVPLQDILTPRSS